MRISTTIGGALGAAAAIALLAGCSGDGSPDTSLGGFNGVQSAARHGVGGSTGPFNSSVLPARYQHAFTPKLRRSWMTHVDALQRLTYLSDFYNGTVTVFTRGGTQVGQIAGLANPQGLFVDSNRNLWVANTGGSNVLVYPRGATSPSATLDDPDERPSDVTVCPNGTVYVSNIIKGSTLGGDISVYAPGATSPTGKLGLPNQGRDFFITCDANDNVFSTIQFPDVSYGVVEYAGGLQTGESQLPIGLQFPGGIKLNNAGNLLVADQNAHTVTEYTEAGSPTGNSITTGSGDWSDIATTRNNATVIGADAVLLEGTSLLFPSGAHRQTYTSSFALPVGTAFDPGQTGLGL